MKNQKISTALGTAIIIIFAITAGMLISNCKIIQSPLTQTSKMQNNLKLKKTNNGQNNLSEKNEWKKYTDTDSGYSIMYPQDYIVQKYDSPCKSHPNNESGQNVIFSIPSFLHTNGSAYENDIEAGKITDIDIYVNDPNDKCIKNAYSSVGGPMAQTPKLIYSENVKINGRTVFKRTYAHLDPEGSQSTFHFSTWRFNKNGQYYTLMFNNGVRIMKPEIQNSLFEKIIKSFETTSDILDISQWDTFNSVASSKFHFSFKHPKLWFNPSDEAGDSFQSFPFYSKDNYTNTCQETDHGSTECKETGRVASVSIYSSTFIPREVKYDNSKSHPITVDGYKGSVNEGTVNDLKGGNVAENGKKEIVALFPDVRGMHFRVVMKLENDTDGSVFDQAISTIKF